MYSKISTRTRKAALRRALMATRPDYFAWLPEAQEKYRLALPKDDEFRIEQILLRTLFDIKVNTQEQLWAASDDFGPEQWLVYNSALLPLHGIGENCFYLAEFLPSDQTLADFPTLYDYDVDDYIFQEQFRQEQFADYVPKPYRGSPCYRWARLEINGVFTYASLAIAAVYLYGCLENFADDYIKELIPHEYVDGPNHGKREGRGVLWNLEIDADGKERELEELKDRYSRYLSERLDHFLMEYDHKALRQVYCFDTSSKHDPQIDFVFSDKTALQAVRFRHFMRDCAALSGDTQELEDREEEERQAAKAFIDREYWDILQNFDPNVVKFRKKNKIIMTDRALQDLQRLDAPPDD